MSAPELREFLELRSTASGEPESTRLGDGAVLAYAGRTMTRLAGFAPTTLFPGLQQSPVGGVVPAPLALDPGLDALLDIYEQRANPLGALGANAAFAPGAAGPAAPDLANALAQGLQSARMFSAATPGALNPFGAPAAAANDPNGLVQLLQLVVGLMAMLAQMRMLNGGGAPAPSGGGSGGGGGGPSTRPSGGSGPARRAPAPQAPRGDDGTRPAAGGGNAAFQIAMQHLGKNAAQIKVAGDALGRAMHDGIPNNVNCANFVSGCLEAAGLLPKSQHSNSVVGLQANLDKNPKFKRVSLKDAKPGDVVSMKTPGGHHVVMFAGWKNGKPQFIGSNNANADGSQRVTIGGMNYQILSVHQYRG